MSTVVRFTKDWNGHKKGDVKLLRHAEAKQAFKASAVVVQTNIAPVEEVTKSQETKVSSDGNTQRLRTHKSSRR